MHAPPAPCTHVHAHNANVKYAHNSCSTGGKTLDLDRSDLALARACNMSSTRTLPDVMETGETEDPRWAASYRREIRRQQRDILNDVHSKPYKSTFGHFLLCYCQIGGGYM